MSMVDPLISWHSSLKCCQCPVVSCSVAEPRYFSPAPAPHFFSTPAPDKKDFSFVSTQEISAPTGSGSEKQIVNICLDSAPILTQNIYIFIKASIKLDLVPNTEEP